MNNKQKKQIEKRILNSLIFHDNKFCLIDLDGLIRDLEDVVISTKKLSFTSKTNPTPKNFTKWIENHVCEYIESEERMKVNVTERDKDIYYAAYCDGYFDAYEDLTGYDYILEGNFEIS